MSIIQAVLDFFSRNIEAILKLFSPVSPDVSAFLLTIIVVVLLGLLIYFFVILGTVVRRTRNPNGRDDDGDEDALAKKYQGSSKLDECRNDLIEAREKLKLMKTDPPYDRIERLYFGINGITNSGLILSSSLLLYEFFKTRSKPPSTAIAVSAEAGRVMGMLAFTLLVSAIVIYMTSHDGGRSYQRINRAFGISFVLSIASFGFFVTFVSPW